MPVTRAVIGHGNSLKNFRRQKFTSNNAFVSSIRTTKTYVSNQFMQPLFQEIALHTLSRSNMLLVAKIAGK